MSLTNLSQIKGGLQLQKDVAASFRKENIVAATVDTSAQDYAASDEKVLSEKAVAAQLAALKKALEDSAARQQIDKVAVTAPVTTFTLTQTPNDKKVVMYINHLAYHEEEDFTVDRVQKTVTWTATAANNGFDIDTELTDAVRFEYEYKPAAE